MKPKMLFVSNEFRIPIATGARHRISNIINTLSRICTIDLVAPRSFKCNANEIDDFLKLRVRHAHWVDCTKKSRSVANQTCSWLINPRGIHACDFLSFRVKLKEILSQSAKYEMVFIDRWYLAGLFATIKATTKTAPYSILDVDGSEYEARKKSANSDSDPRLFSRLKRCIECGRVLAWERRMLPQFNTVLMSSLSEMERLKKRNNLENLLLVENGYDTPNGNERNLPDPKPSILFVGTLSYGPNLEAFMYLYQEIFPLIKQHVPQVKVVHVGDVPKEIYKSLQPDSNVELMGYVKDLSFAYAKATIVAAPVLQGTGTRIKILEAAAYGKAIVSTTFGAQDIALSHQKSIMLADDPTQFSEHCIALLRNPSLRESIGLNARALLTQRYSWETVTRSLVDKILTR